MSWNSVTISDKTKNFAWKGVMAALKDDDTISPHIRALMELLVEERREMLDTQQKLVGILEKLERKVDVLTASSSSSAKSTGSSTATHTPASDAYENGGTRQNNNCTDSYVTEGYVGRGMPGSVASTSGGLHHVAATSHNGILEQYIDSDNLFNDLQRVPKSELDTYVYEGNGGTIDSSNDGEDDGMTEMERIAMNALNHVANNNKSDLLNGPMSKKKRSSTGEGISGVGLDIQHSCRFPECTASFADPNDLIEHITRHVYATKTHCPVCGLSIRSETRLRDHMNQHTGEKPYVCEWCGKAFTRVDSKNGHLKKCNERMQVDGNPYMMS